MNEDRAIGTVALQDQIADDLRDQIASGRLPAGQPLPSVRVLQQQWECSDGPVREALATLRREGRITGGRGKPPVVREQPQRIKLAIDMAETQKKLVLRPDEDRHVTGAIELTSGISIEDTISTHHYDVIPASGDLSAEFAVHDGVELQRRTYEMREPTTGVRLSWSVSYIPLSLIEGNPELLDESNEPWPGGHQHQLYTVGIEVDRFVRSVIAVEPTPGERQRWGMEIGTPLLRVRSRSIDIDNRVVEISDASYPADRTEITFTERLTRWPEDHPRYIGKTSKSKEI
jgi:GntR family transcriptional regulator